MASPAEVHAAIVARVQERLALAQAVPPLGHVYDMGGNRLDERHWMFRGVPSGDDGSYRRESDRAAQALWDANDPAFTIRMCTAALNRLERHRPRFHPAGRPVCFECRGEVLQQSPCDVERDEAAVWGVEVDGDGA